MNEEQVRTLMLFLNAGIKVMSARLILVITLFLGFSLFAWAMADPTHERIGIATLFSVLVFLPVIRADSKANEATKKVVEGE